MQSRTGFRVFALSLAWVFVLSSVSLAMDATKALPPRFREWLSKDAAYIITNQERDAFLQLSSDDARDKFIERFWEVRNPTPGSPDNPYKAEHYRRIEYANNYFGHASHTEGWKTPMGQVYITLGEPAQRQKLLGLQKLTPMEIWFYSNANSALPPFFYVIFYQRDINDEFRLYSPYSDGPEKLITAQVGTTRQEALRIIGQDAGSDVARETLSLLPDEPVDMRGGSVSLQSDVMLATIKNLANNPISLSELNNRRQLLEDVTHRVVLGEEYLDVVTVPLRDPSGNTNLHYVTRLKKPEDFSVAESEKSGYYYSVLAAVKVQGPDGKTILSEEKKISRPLSPVQMEKIKSRVFGYEGWLPLPPNKYKIEFQITNLLSNTAYRRQVEVVVPDPKAEGLQVSNLVPFADASMVPPESNNALPFGSAGVKFIPMVGQELRYAKGESLKFFYQVWVPDDTKSRAGTKLPVDYVYGRLGAQDSQTIHDEIPLNQLDAGGSVVNGKQILTGELAPGNYRLLMTIHDPLTQAKVYGSLNFGVFEAASAPPAWDISDDQLAENVKNGGVDYQRGLCYLALGDKAHATDSFQAAYSKNSGDERYRSKLAELYFDQQKYDKVIALYAHSGLSDTTDDGTVVRLADSYDKLGELKSALGVVESAAAARPSSGTLQLALAGYYRKSGEADKAALAERKGKQLMAPPPAS
jgi:GWxTD domain-containing protein